MIVRMWHGRVMTSDARAYREFVNERAIPDYQSVPGNISVHILEREEGDLTHFITMTFWDSLAAISGFAGDDAEAAKYYPGLIRNLWYPILGRGEDEVGMYIDAGVPRYVWREHFVGRRQELETEPPPADRIYK